MNNLRLIQYGLWGLVIVAIGFATVTTGWWQKREPGRTSSVLDETLPALGIGGPFTMKDNRGRRFTEYDIRGRTTLMFFGFTSCPEICPTTLANISALLEKAGPDANRLNAIFVTVDPARDTVERLSQYLVAFDARIIGLTGTQSQLSSMAKTFRFYFQRVELKGSDYTMDHTALIYILDTEGKFAGTIDYHEDSQVAIAKVRQILARQARPRSG